MDESEDRGMTQGTQDTGDQFADVTPVIDLQCRACSSSLRLATYSISRVGWQQDFERNPTHQISLGLLCIGCGQWWRLVVRPAESAGDITATLEPIEG